MTATPSPSRGELERLEHKHADDPDGRYFVPLANAYRQAGRLADAEELLRAGLRRHPGYVSARIVLGRCLVDRGEAAPAEEEFREVLTHDPQNLVALRTLGELAASGGRADEASRWYEDLLAIDPMNEGAREALEALRASRGEVGGAPTSASFGEAPIGESAPAPPVPDEPARAGTLTGQDPDAGSPTEAPEAEDYDALLGSMIDLDARGGEEGGAQLPFAEEGDAVVTETIAELYTRQGFFDRAAEVYRELIRRRGGDPGLEERLHQVERLMAGEESEDEVGARGEREPPSAGQPQEMEGSYDPLSADQEQEEDLFAHTFETGFPSIEPLDESLDELMEPPEAAPAPLASGEGGGTIRAELRQLLAWTPVAPVSGLAEPEDDWRQPAAEAAPEGEAAGTEVRPAEAVVAPVDDEPFPWELPAEDESAELAGEQTSPPALAGASDPAEGEEDAVDAEPTGELAEPRATEPAAEADEDEDLESFQAWLRSLKR